MDLSSLTLPEDCKKFKSKEKYKVKNYNKFENGAKTQKYSEKNEKKGSNYNKKQHYDENVYVNQFNGNGSGFIDPAIMNSKIKQTNGTSLIYESPSHKDLSRQSSTNVEKILPDI